MTVACCEETVRSQVDRHVSELFGEFASIGSRAFGFSLFSPFGNKLDPISGIISRGYDPQWKQLYSNMRFRAADPILESMSKGESMVGWRRRLYERPLTEPQRHFRLKYEEMQIGDGISMHLNGPSGYSAIAFCSADSDTFVNRMNVVEHIRYVAQSCHDRIVTEMLDGRRQAIGLSERERQVLRGITDGENNRQIASRLQISLASIDTYVQRVYTKLGVTGRVNAAREALQWGLLEN